jgi:RND family efflux transporter MFP subunit
MAVVVAQMVAGVERIMAERSFAASTQLEAQHRQTRCAWTPAALAGLSSDSKYGRMRRGRRGLLLLMAAACAACNRSNRYAPPPPPEVTVSRPVDQEVTTYNEFTGYTAAIETVDIRARVQGYLKSYNFTPGNPVKKGDLLFVIEPDLYQAQVDQAQANLEGSLAQSKAAQTQLEITEAIYARSAGSRTDLVQKTQQRDLTKAQVEIARANLEQAKLNLSYTHIFAPFDGRIDRNQFDVGNLVGAGQATVLATLVREDPIYAYFTASERALLQYRELQRQRRTVAPAGEHNIAYLELATETGFPHLGKVDYAGNRVDPGTGTIEVRAVFANPDRVIIPGLFARVRLPFTREQALLIPDVAVSADQGGRYLLIVDEKNTVQYRRVQLGPLVDGGMRVVQSGLTKDEWIVVNGLQRARPGSVVKPTRTESKVAAPAPPHAVNESPQ